MRIRILRKVFKKKVRFLFVRWLLDSIKENDMKKYLLIVLLIDICFGQYDFSLTDINPSSETYGQNIGPSSFNNSIRVLGFFHEY